MALNAKKVKGSGGGNRVEQPNLEPAGYPGRVVQIIDFGIQAQQPFKGKEKPPVQMIGLTYELADEFMVDEEGNPQEDKPRWLGEIIPLHNLKAEKAKSTQRYNALDPKGECDGDFTALVGAPVTINVVNNVSKSNGKVYDNVESLSAMRKKEAEKAPELVNEPKVFVLDEPDLEVFRSFPEWIQERIMENLEYNGSKLQALIQGGDTNADDSSTDDTGNDEAGEGTEDGDDEGNDW